MKLCNTALFIQFIFILVILYTPEILNTNIEQEIQKMVDSYTP